LKEPLVIAGQGSFAVGGTVLKSPGNFDPYPIYPGPAGQTLHGDHAYVQYQLPVDARRHPLVMLHGGTTFGKTWESTFDDREGYQSLFLRRGYPVYIVDRPRQGRAGKMTEGAAFEPRFSEQATFCVWRLGVWPNYFPNVQVPRDPAFLEQIFRSQFPSLGPRNHRLTSDALSALMKKIGPAVLVTHSFGGIQGWLTALQGANIAGLVAYEPTQFVYPADEMPTPIMSGDAMVRDITEDLPASLPEFGRLTKFPIQIVYGDNIPREPSPHGGLDLWRVAVPKANQFVAALRRHGGEAEVVELPKLGLTGNTHCPFSDLNNVEVAGLMEAWLARHGLDGR
jgi:pimeloyl-ACP methyl ester carboxylesterase